MEAVFVPVRPGATVSFPRAAQAQELRVLGAHRQSHRGTRWPLAGAAKASGEQGIQVNVL